MHAYLRTLPDSIPLFGLVIVALLLLTPAASAEVLADEGSNYATFDLESSTGSIRYIPDEFTIYRIQEWDGLYFVYLKSRIIDNPSVLTTNPSYDEDVSLTIGDNVVGSGTAHYNALYDSAGSVTGVQFWLDIDNWNPTGYTGTQLVNVIPSSGTLFNGVKVAYAKDVKPSPDRPIGFCTPSNTLFHGIHLARSHYYWQNAIDISDEFVSLTRHLDGNEYVSTLEITSDAGYLEDTSPNNVNLPYVGTGTWTVTNPHGRIYSGILGSDAPTNTATVSVYVVDSQTGYLLQGTDTRIQMMNASAEWEEVFNQTNFAGSAKIPLEKTTDPDGIPYYWIQSTRAGYQQVPETQIFSVYGDRQVIVEMEPTGAPPVDPGNAFVEFYVFDWLHNPINHVAVKIGDEYLYTNRQGWVQYELPKNTTYTYTLTAPGYITTTGSVVVGADPRYRVDVEMQVGTVPTNTPTLAPGETPGATPTPDHRTNEQKGQAVIDMIADNAEGIGALALLCLLMGLLKLLAKW